MPPTEINVPKQCNLRAPAAVAQYVFELYRLGRVTSARTRNQYDANNTENCFSLLLRSLALLECTL